VQKQEYHIKKNYLGGQTKEAKRQVEIAKSGRGLRELWSFLRGIFSAFRTVLGVLQTVTGERKGEDTLAKQHAGT